MVRPLSEPEACCSTLKVCAVLLAIAGGREGGREREVKMGEWKEGEKAVSLLP